MKGRLTEEWIDTTLVVVWVCLASYMATHFLYVLATHQEMPQHYVVVALVSALLFTSTLRILAARGRSWLNFVGSVIACLLIEVGAIWLRHIPPLSAATIAHAALLSGMAVAIGESLLPTHLLVAVWNRLRPRPRAAIRRKIIPTQ